MKLSSCRNWGGMLRSFSSVSTNPEQPRSFSEEPRAKRTNSRPTRNNTLTPAGESQDRIQSSWAHDKHSYTLFPNHLARPIWTSSNIFQVSCWLEVLGFKPDVLPLNNSDSYGFWIIWELQESRISVSNFFPKMLANEFTEVVLWYQAILLTQSSAAKVEL